jgi:hypothetical protein
VGVAIAHVLALQLILTSGLATQMAFAPGNSQAICHNQAPDSLTTDEQNPAKQARHHEACSICAFAAGPHWLPCQLASLLVRRSPSTAVFATTWLNQSPIRGHEPRTSQGLPQPV